MNMRPKIVIDLGSCNITGATEDRVVTLPSQIIRNIQTDQTVCVGEAVRTQPEPTLPKKLVPAKRSGRLVDYKATQRVIQYIINELVSWWTLFRPHVLTALDLQATTAESQQIKKAARTAGAQSVYTTKSIILSAFGAGVSPTSSTGQLVADIGGGKTEAAVIVRGSVVVSNDINTGGNQLVRDIVAHLKDAYECSISRNQARHLLSDIGTAISQDNPAKTSVTDTQTGQEVVVSGNDIAAAVQASLQEIVNCLHELLQEASAALLTDISQSGVTIGGGVGNLPYIDTFFSRRLSVPVTVADNPGTVVVRGGRVAWSQVSQHPQYPRIAQVN
jgi:rod shape-determining protein MreB